MVFQDNIIQKSIIVLFLFIVSEETYSFNDKSNQFVKSNSLISLKSPTPGILSGKVNIEQNLVSTKNSRVNGYFPLAFTGNGVDHMNINLVLLDKAGIRLGDEIGVFDGDLCAGAAIIEEKHIKDNSISIAASANDRTESNPNGYTSGNKISLKLYRNKIVYLLYFTTVNNSLDLFERGGSMFALIDFSKSTSTSSFLNQTEINLYPNPFNQAIKIEIYLSQPQKLVCEIFDVNGNPVRTFAPGDDDLSDSWIEFTWDGKNNNGQRVAYGIYFCRTNQTITRIVFNSSQNSN
jgi:hypothetical protein